MGGFIRGGLDRAFDNDTMAARSSDAAASPAWGWMTSSLPACSSGRVAGRFALFLRIDGEYLRFGCICVSELLHFL
jgi:hypothetical protein